ncbi:hypothetical protein CVT26_010356, partial [Gymnopilus dilepis]
AVVGGYVPDALADIQRKYFKRYPVELPHNEEPTSEHLAGVDDDAPDAEIEEPNREAMDEQEFQIALSTLEKRREQIRFRKGQIKRWMAYQYMKDQDTGGKPDPRSDPCFSNLVNQLSGKEAGRPRKKTAVNVWRKTQRDNIEVKVKNLAESKGVSKGHWAALRDKVARDLFGQLPTETQEKWKKQAEEETKFAIEEYERSLKADPSTKAEDRQRSIQGIVRTTQPILDTLSKTTGWNFTLLAGGPEPAHGGKLNIISVHTGVTTGDMKMNFGRSERADYKKYIVPIFGRFLKKCFSPEECRSRALAAEDGLVPLQEEELEVNGATLDSLEEPDLQRVQDLSQIRHTAVPCEPSAHTSHQLSPPLAPPTRTPTHSESSTHASTEITSTSPTSTLAVSPIQRDHTDSPPLEAHLPDAVQAEPRESGIRPPQASTAVPDPIVATDIHMKNSPTLEQQHSAPESDPDSAAVAAATSLQPEQESSGQELHRHQDPVATPASSLTTAAVVDRCLMDTSDGSSAQLHSLRQSPPLSPRASPPTSPRSSIPCTSAFPSMPSPQPDLHRLSPPLSPRASPPSSPRTSTSGFPCLSAPAPQSESGSQSRQCSPTRITTAPIPPAASPSISTRSSTKRRVSSTSLFNASPSKRPRFVRDMSPSSFSTSSSVTQRAIEIEQDAPKWFANALLMLQMVDLGPYWFDLLESWARFEMRGGYKERGKLGAQHRPGCIGDWIQRKRSPTWRPILEEAVVGESFRRWWVALQPKWRLSDDNKIIPSALQGDWSSLCKPGLNGLHSVIVGLFFWGIAARKECVEEERWEQGVGDVNQVLIAMLNHHDTFDI